MNTNEHEIDFKTDQDAMIPLICALINKSDFKEQGFEDPLVSEELTDPFFWVEIVENARGIYDAYVENYKKQY